MQNQTKRLSVPSLADHEPSEACRRMPEVRDALRPIAGKWKGEILWQLAQQTSRFGELRRAIPGITQHMLTAQLRELEADGLVRRTVFAEVPPRVEYEMTDAARALRPVFEALFAWLNAYGPKPALERASTSRPKERWTPRPTRMPAP